MMSVLEILDEKLKELDRPLNKKKGECGKHPNRIKSYLEAVDCDAVGDYHDRKRRYFGLRKCPICWSCKKCYVIKKINEEVVFAQCFNCDFLFNPHDMPLLKASNCRSFNRDDLRINKNTSPKYKIID